jgi:fluoride exporter
VTASPSLPRLLAAVAVGGALGAVARWALQEWEPDGTGFPWTTFAVNVTGSFLLACLPALPRVRRSRTATVLLGPGVLGGYTTLSTYSEQARRLLADDRAALAAAYLLGTLAACLLAVAVADRWSAPAVRRAFAAEGGDE